MVGTLDTSITILKVSETDTLKLGERDNSLSITNNEDVVDAGSEALLTFILNVDDLE